MTPNLILASLIQVNPILASLIQVNPILANPTPVSPTPVSPTQESRSRILYFRHPHHRLRLRHPLPFNRCSK